MAIGTRTRHLLAVVCLCIGPPALAQEQGVGAAGEPRDDPPAEGLAVGAYAGGVVALLGLPMIGPEIGADVRVPLWDSVVVAPHVEGAFPSLMLIGVLSVQGGVPLIVGPTTTDSWTPYIGGGPVFTLATLAGHVEGPIPPMVLLGGEVLGGATLPLACGLRGRVQLRGSMSVNIPMTTVLLEASATAGLMWTF